MQPFRFFLSLKLETMVPSVICITEKCMAKKTTPAKLQNLLEKIKECIKTGNYIFTAHALERQNERVIDT